MRRKRVPHRGTWRAFAAVAIVTGLLLILDPIRGGCGPNPFLNDTSRLREIVGFVFAPTFDYPMKDDAFDPYAFVRRGDIPRDRYDLFRSERAGMGPTDEEIARGDYTNFPWERHRGEIVFDPVIPLLWEKVPDKHGGRLVALSDGSARYFEAEEFEALLRKAAPETGPTTPSARKER